MKSDKEYFIQSLQEYAECLTEYVSTHSGDWSIKGFIDIDTSVYTLSADTKMISKILEIQIFPKIQLFADKMGYELILAEKQNWYPDMSFVKKSDTSVKFAVDLKTTYRLDEYQDFCNGFHIGIPRGILHQPKELQEYSISIWCIPIPSQLVRHLYAYWIGRH